MLESTSPDAMPSDVVAVVVTYRPSQAEIEALLRALANQVGSVVVVDNGSAETTVVELRAVAAELGIVILSLGSNRGLGAAQNIGIDWAREQRARFVLLCDQDSLPASDMVQRLLDGFARGASEAIAGRARPLAAVGPITIDQRNPGAPLLFSAHRWGPRRAVVPTDTGALVDAAFLIASGCLIDLTALDQIGPMNETWFIDHLDLEWGLRATRAGYRLCGVVGSSLAHSLGDRTQRIPGRGRDVHIHSPARNYFMARNTVLLIRSGLMSGWWALGYVAWIAKYGVFYVLAVPPRRTRAVLLLQGLWHGLRGRSGPLGPIDVDGVGELGPTEAAGPVS